MESHSSISTNVDLLTNVVVLTTFDSKINKVRYLRLCSHFSSQLST